MINDNRKSEKKRSPLFFIFIIVIVILVTHSITKNHFLEERTKKSAQSENVQTAESMTTPDKSDGEIKTWGPDRILYSWDMRADHATINSIYDNPVVGDERNFVRIRRADSEDKFGDNVVAEPGAEYEVQIFFHNNADPNLNDDTNKISAQNIRVRVDNISASITKGESATIKGIISATNTDPKEVWDTAYIQTDQTVSLRYVKGSARLHTEGDLNNKVIDDEALFGKAGGTFVGYNQWRLYRAESNTAEV